MPMMEKSKLLNFAKKSASKPSAVGLLAQKRAEAKGTKPDASVELPHEEMPGDEQEVYLHELVEESAQEAEAGQDIELEDAIAGSHSQSLEDVPAWAEDQEKWREAAEAVGLGSAGHDLYDEPDVVTAYLYRKLGGPVKGMEIPAPPEAPQVDGQTDMAKPGAAAKAIHAAKAVKTNNAGEGATGELKAMLDEAVREGPSPDIVEKLKTYNPEVDGNPPPWAEDADKWDRAVEAVKPYWDKYDEPYAVVSTIYSKLGGGISK